MTSSLVLSLPLRQLLEFQMPSKPPHHDRTSWVFGQIALNGWCKCALLELLILLLFLDMLTLSHLVAFLILYALS